VILGFARRLDASQGFAIELEDITDQCHQDTLEASVAALNQAVEALVRRAPEQYQWEYRRFKHTLEQNG
jgi:KDO2-lipid IV(A) lauroyltransferase